MGSLLGGPLSPIGWDIGLIGAPLETTLARLVQWRKTLGRRLSTQRPVGRYPECLYLLAPLEALWKRELLIQAGDWTVYLNNSINGGDSFPATSMLGNYLRCRSIVAIHQPMTPVGHASTQLQLFGPEGEPPLLYIRTIAAHAEDGRWSWDVSGSPLPFEDTELYERRLKKERFTRETLMRYLTALTGLDLDDDRAFGEAALVTQRALRQGRVESLQEARARWGLG
jgi:hypothetical protein